MANLTGPAQAFVGNTSAVDTSAQEKLGKRAWDETGNEYIYLQGVASTVAGSWVTFDENYATTLLVANAVGPVGIAMAAMVASRYGWYQIYGVNIIAKTDTVAADQALFIDGTAGQADDLGIAGDGIIGATSMAASVAGVCTVHLNYPYVSNDLGAGGTSSPGGADTNVQFNDSTTFNGDSTFTFNKNTGLLTVGTATVSGVFKSGSTTVTGTATITSGLVVGGSATVTGNVSVLDEVYGAGWNGDTNVPTKNAVYDKIETLGGAGANTALSNLAAVAVNRDLNPGADNTSSVGTAGLSWSDIYLGDGAVMDFKNGNLVITHSNRLITITGSTSVSGNETVTGTVTVSGNAVVNGTKLTVAGSEFITGSTTVSGNLAVTGTATVSSNLNVTGTATVSSNANITGTASVTGNLAVTGSTTVTTNLTGPVRVDSGVVGVSGSAAVRIFEIKVIDDATVLTTGSAKVVICVPSYLDGGTIQVPQAFISTTTSSGSVVVYLRNSAYTGQITSTPISINVNGFTSYPTGTQAVVGTATVNTGNLLLIDVEGEGTGAKGLGVIIPIQRL